MRLEAAMLNKIPCKRGGYLSSVKRDVQMQHPEHVRHTYTSVLGQIHKAVFLPATPPSTLCGIPQINIKFFG